MLKYNRDRYKIALLGIGTGLYILERGLDVSGIENLPLAIALWVFGALLIVPAGVFLVYGWIKNRGSGQEAATKDSQSAVIAQVPTPSPFVQVGLSTDMEWSVGRGPESPKVSETNFTTEGRLDRLIAVPPLGKIQTLRFISGDGKKVKEEDLPCEVECGDARLIVKRLTGVGGGGSNRRIWDGGGSSKC